MNPYVYNVHMHAFHNPVVIRQVDISEAMEDLDPNIQMPLSQSNLLELIFKYGQNMFQSVPGRYSVSVGDVIELHDGSFHMVGGVGFFPISPETKEKLPLNLASKVLFPKDEEDLLNKIDEVGR